jgi:hypothetical protein
LEYRHRRAAENEELAHADVVTFLKSRQSHQ